MKKLIALYSGPGAGKSCVSAGLFHDMKLANADVELCREFVKEWVWEDRPINHGDQIYFFSQQMRRELTLLRKVDTVITDSPLRLVQCYENLYCPYTKVIPAMLTKYEEIIADMGVKCYHIFLHRDKSRGYNTNGRRESLKQAENIDSMIRNTWGDFFDVSVGPNAVQDIKNLITKLGD